MKYVVFMCRTIKIFISNWPRTRQFSQLLQVGETVAFDFSHHGRALVTLYVQFLCSDWSKFHRWVRSEDLCTILKLVYFDGWSWHSFVSTCVVFNCLFKSIAHTANMALVKSENRLADNNNNNNNINNNNNNLYTGSSLHKKWYSVRPCKTIAKNKWS